MKRYSVTRLDARNKFTAACAGKIRFSCTRSLERPRSIIHPRILWWPYKAKPASCKSIPEKVLGNSPAKTLNISRLEARDGNEKLQCFSISSSPIQTRIFSSAHCMNVRSVIE